MILKIHFDEQTVSLNLEEDFLRQAAGFFTKMDADMDNGWQMGRDWIEKPDFHQRLVIAADKMLTALENNDRNLGMMMAGYIHSRAPRVTVIELDITGQLGHDFIEDEINPAPSFTPQSTVSAVNNGPLDKISAMQQAGKEVSRVFKAGKQYKFSLFNPETGQWEESPAIASKDEAEKLRDFAFKKRFDLLVGAN